MCKFWVSVPVFEIPKMFLKSYVDRSVSLSDIFLIAILIIWLINADFLKLLQLLFLFWVNSLATDFSVLNEILRLIFLNNLVINFVSRTTYVNVAHFVLGFIPPPPSVRSSVFASFVYGFF